jgi:hypothetical protein
MTNLADGLALAETIRTNLTEASSMHGHVRINATASFGVVSTRLLPHLPSIASHALIARTDELMYAAKRIGRNRVHVAEWNVTSFTSAELKRNWPQPTHYEALPTYGRTFETGVCSTVPALSYLLAARRLAWPVP